MSDSLSFEGEIGAERASDEPALMVEVDGFEGPLDLLLSLARNQKVDIAKISILTLADQYLAFIESARKLRLELAADYLVMAAWLAYLKSRLLLPEVADPNSPSADEMADAAGVAAPAAGCVWRVSARLMDRPQVERDVFRAVIRNRSPSSRRRNGPDTVRSAVGLCGAAPAERAWPRQFEAGNVWSLQEARQALERLIGRAGDWSRLDEYLISYMVEPAMRATVFASSLASTLELVREGVIELHQQSAFAPIYLRKREVVGHVAAATNDTAPRTIE